MLNTAIKREIGHPRVKEGTQIIIDFLYILMLKTMKNYVQNELFAILYVYANMQYMYIY